MMMQKPGPNENNSHARPLVVLLNLLNIFFGSYSQIYDEVYAKGILYYLD
jgi:hypothetical protein